mmetsp:Transcript_10418/g.34398  ORF Transcript_10418/g.34398 Transcript_10418/m.34398 type:complete len:163 (-) Transcript_10418:430-918(-)
MGGVTRLKFHEDLLYAGGRAERDGSVRAWDLRSTRRPRARYPRRCPSNQRLGFDLKGTKLATADDQRGVLLYDLDAEESPPAVLQSGPGGRDMINDVTFHPFVPLVALALGRRCFPGDPTNDQRRTAANRRSAVQIRQSPLPRDWFDDDSWRHVRALAPDAK